MNTGYGLDDRRFGHPRRLFANTNTPDELKAAREAAAAQDGWRAQPRIRAFMDASPLPIVSFEARRSRARPRSYWCGARIAQPRLPRGGIKHVLDGFDIDVPDTDTYRFRELGAEVVGISSPDKYVWQDSVSVEPGLLELVCQISEPVDLVITEGFKK